MTPGFLVIDASAIVELLLGTSSGEAIRERIQKSKFSLHCPELVDLEVLSALHQRQTKREISKEAATSALRELAEMSIMRYSHLQFLSQIWEVRGNITAYDAAYVALAKDLDATLITTDGRLSRAPWLKKLEVKCEVFPSTSRRPPRQAPRRRAARAKPRVKRSPAA